MEEEIKIYWQKRGEELVDLLYDGGYLNPALKRASFKELEKYISYTYQSYSESSVKAARLTDKFKDLKK